MTLTSAVGVWAASVAVTGQSRPIDPSENHFASTTSCTATSPRDPITSPSHRPGPHGHVYETAANRLDSIAARYLATSRRPAVATREPDESLTTADMVPDQGFLLWALLGQHLGLARIVTESPKRQ